MSDFDALITQTASRLGVPVNLARALVRLESGGNPRARSPVGAMGLTQLMPGTARGLGVHDPYDPAQNLQGGLTYYKQQYDRFHDPGLAYAAYNAGPGAVAKYHGIPPYAETQKAVKLFQQYAGSPAPMANSTRQAKPVPKPRIEAQFPQQTPNPYQGVTDNLVNSLSGGLGTRMQSPYTQPLPSDLLHAMGYNPAPVSTPPLSDLADPLHLQGTAPAQTPFTLIADLNRQMGNAPTTSDYQRQQELQRQGSDQTLAQLMQAHQPQPINFPSVEGGPYPQRTFPSVPGRPAPGTEPISTLLGALAGFADPVGAGRYNTSPLVASANVANQQYDDRLQQWQMAISQGQESQADAERAYAAHQQQAMFNAEHGYDAATRNQATEQNFFGRLNPIQAEQAGITAGLPALADLAQREHTAGEAGRNVGLLGSYIQDQERLGQLGMQNDLKRVSVLQALLNHADMDRYHTDLIAERGAAAGLRGDVQQRGQDLGYQNNQDRIGAMEPLRAAQSGLADARTDYLSGAQTNLTNAKAGQVQQGADIDKQLKLQKIEQTDPGIATAVGQLKAAVAHRDHMMQAYANAETQGKVQDMAGFMHLIGQANNDITAANQAVQAARADYKLKHPAAPANTSHTPASDTVKTAPGKKTKTVPFSSGAKAGGNVLHFDSNGNPR